MQRCHWGLLVVLVLSLVLVGPAQSQDASPKDWLKGFSAEVQRVMADWQVPGLAVGVVTDSTVLLSDGFGTRDVGTGAPVTPQTRFAIGSSTKAFTAASLGVLHDDGALDWSTPVRRYLPAFGLDDPFASQRATAVDLLTHRTGLPGHDLLWEATALSRAELVQRLRHLPASAPFRTTFQYSNLSYVVAGALAGAVHGTSWETVVRRRLFAPLDMEHSTLSVDSMRVTENHARPYDRQADSLVAVPPRRLKAVAPAGGINSSVADMVNWVQLFLNDGRHDSTQVLGAETVAHLVRPRIVWTDYPIQVEEIGGPSMYALGWFVQTYCGHRLVQHGGNIDGYSALVGFLPEKDVGWVILTNRDDGTPATHALMYELIDRRLGRDGPDWSQRLFERYAPPSLALANENGAPSESAPEVSRTDPPRPLADYTGTYRHPGYGTIRVTRMEGRLVARYGGVRDTLRHRRDDAFEMELRAGRDTYYRNLTFGEAPDGTLDRVTIPMSLAVDPISFVRMEAK